MCAGGGGDSPHALWGWLPWAVLAYLGAIFLQGGAGAGMTGGAGVGSRDCRWHRCMAEGVMGGRSRGCQVEGAAS